MSVFLYIEKMETGWCLRGGGGGDRIKVKGLTKEHIYIPHGYGQSLVKAGVGGGGQMVGKRGTSAIMSLKNFF